MDHLKAKLTAIKKRNGFHYFPDSNHYREKDLDLWLPILKSLETKTLVLVSPTTRAIPEFFISAVANEKINIIIDFNLYGKAAISESDLEPLITAYGKWGAAYAILNKDVNCRTSWDDAQWASGNPVQKSWANWMMFSKLAHDNGIKPVLPTMIPGGDFWDLAFLEQFFKYAASSSDSYLMGDLVISVLAWDWNRHLNWGSGGPEKWTDAKPYKTPKGSQDQKGFHGFEWYASLAEKILGFIPPVLLFETSIANRNANGIIPPQSSKNANTHLSIARLMAGENVYDPDEPNILLDPVPFYVISNNFYLLSSEDTNPAAACRWFLPDGTPDKSAAALIEWLENGVREKTTIKQSIDVSENNKRSFSKGRYILLPHDLYDKLPEVQEGLSQYIARYKPEIGFSIQDALEAAYILVIGDSNNFSFCDLDLLKHNGNLVQTIDVNELERLNK